MSSDMDLSRSSSSQSLGNTKIPESVGPSRSSSSDSAVSQQRSRISSESSGSSAALSEHQFSVYDPKLRAIETIKTALTRDQNKEILGDLELLNQALTHEWDTEATLEQLSQVLDKVLENRDEAKFYNTDLVHHLSKLQKFLVLEKAESQGFKEGVDHIFKGLDHLKTMVGERTASNEFEVAESLNEFKGHLADTNIGKFALQFTSIRNEIQDLDDALLRQVEEDEVIEEAPLPDLEVPDHLRRYPSEKIGDGGGGPYVQAQSEPAKAEKSRFASVAERITRAFENAVDKVKSLAQRIFNPTSTNEDIEDDFEILKQMPEKGTHYQAVPSYQDMEDKTPYYSMPENPESSSRGSEKTSYEKIPSNLEGSSSEIESSPFQSAQSIPQPMQNVQNQYMTKPADESRIDTSEMVPDAPTGYRSMQRADLEKLIQDRLGQPIETTGEAKKIGQGAYGIVNKETWDNQPCVVKYPILNGDREKLLKEFYAEILVGLDAQEGSENIVKVLAYKLNNGIICPVSEYCNEGSLDNILEKRADPYPEDQFRNMLLEMARGIQHLHNQDIVHRDIAARNLLVDNGVIKVADFGLAREMSAEDKRKTLADVGPLKWMAPEALTQGLYSKKTDVWSFALTAIEIWTRKEPYPEIDSVLAAFQVAKGELNPPLIDTKNPALQSLIQQCTQRNPDERPSFEEIIQWLENIS